jgi:hypothetical protein
MKRRDFVARLGGVAAASSYGAAFPPALSRPQF